MHTAPPRDEFVDMQLVWATVAWLFGSGAIGWVISRPRLVGQNKPRGWNAGRERTLSIVFCVLAVSALALGLAQLAAKGGGVSGWVLLGASPVIGGSAVGSIIIRRRRLSRPTPVANE